MLYTPVPGVAAKPDNEPMNTMWPCPRATMSAAKRRAINAGDSTFTRNARSICSGV